VSARTGAVLKRVFRVFECLNIYEDAYASATRRMPIYIYLSGPKGKVRLRRLSKAAEFGGAVGRRSCCPARQQAAAAANTFCAGEAHDQALLCACFVALCWRIAAGEESEEGDRIASLDPQSFSCLYAEQELWIYCLGTRTYYELSSNGRQVVGLRYRADDLPGTSYEVEQQRQQQREQPPCNSQRGRVRHGVRVNELGKGKSARASRSGAALLVCCLLHCCTC
jgi:hypothetical protein